MKFLGIDLHLNCFTCYCIDEKGKKVRNSFEIGSPNIEELHRYLTPDVCNG